MSSLSLPPIPILFQNEVFVIVDKPAEMLSVPSRFSQEDARPILGRLLERQLSVKLFPVHRLDFEVSGLLVFALSAEAHRTANSWFEKKMIHKVYQAISEKTDEFKVPDNSEIDWKCKLLRGKKRAYEHEAGKSSVTKGRFLGYHPDNPSWLFWELEPVTGRSHQLRYELYRHQTPIVGDELYGSISKWPKPGIALRAAHISFPKEAEKFGLPPKISAEELGI